MSMEPSELPSPEAVTFMRETFRQHLARTLGPGSSITAHNDTPSQAGVVIASTRARFLGAPFLVGIAVRPFGASSDGSSLTCGGPLYFIREIA
ncbi:MAG: hypothetical protein AAGI70_17610 [Pseudomonadota bacterium]